MQSKLHCLATRIIHEESGQTIVVFSLALIVMLALAGFVIDIGRAMVVNNQLRSSTVAAALAGATEMPNSDYATVAMDYSSCTAPPTGSKIQTGCTTNENNAYAGLGTVTTTAEGYCSSFVANSLNIACETMGTNKANALVVTQTVTMPTTFMRIVGIPSLTFSVTQTAAWKGSGSPHNVAVILDGSGSMNTVDTGNDGCNNMPAEACALSGVQTLLQELEPTSGVNPVDEVALYVFPGLSNAQAASDDAKCAAEIKAASYDYSSTGGFGNNDTTVYYGFPGSSFSGGALLPNPPIYQLVNFSNDYRSSTSTNLSSTSTLVKAVGGGGTATCQYVSKDYFYGVYGGRNASPWAGIQASGGADTYYAGVLYQAQNDLYSEYESRLKSGTQTDNVIILLSDGDANVNGSGTVLGGEVMSNGSPTCQTTSHGVCTSYVEANSNRSGTYPSYNDSCQQAVTAAQSATNGTWPTSQSSSSPVKTTVYTIAFGSETGSCSGESLSPCSTMKKMASSYLTQSSNPDLDFYSDYEDTATGGADQSCTSTNGVTNIQQIFKNIGDGLTSAKLIQTPSGCSANNTASCY
jgi:Flp pilus assembly protein TadG